MFKVRKNNCVHFQYHVNNRIDLTNMYDYIILMV